MKTIGDRQRAPVVTDGFSILVVDDNAVNQQVASAILEHAGYVAEVAFDGRAAIKALESKPFDLVLMDCCMPVMDGFEATRSIRAASSQVLNPEVPIIALTALAVPGDREKCLEAGMDDYLSKPIDSVKLLSVINRCLETALGRVPAEVRRGGAPVIAYPVMAGRDLIETAKQAGFEWPPGLLETVVNLFLDDTPLQITELQAALRSRDGGILRAVSHKIRGSSDVLGTSSISALAKTVEAAAKRKDFERAYELTPKLVEKLQELLRVLAGAGNETTP